MMQWFQAATGAAIYLTLASPVAAMKPALFVNRRPPASDITTTSIQAILDGCTSEEIEKISEAWTELRGWLTATIKRDRDTSQGFEAQGENFTKLWQCPRLPE
ncbi:hypothetical protein BBP40_010798 [Aspergillus hancockii]|nr:hypothetical protein BBP40_010798 [Aspergillus hancockii]